MFNSEFYNDEAPERKRRYGNKYNRNLIWVNNEEYINLERGILLVEELGRQQEYVSYIALKSFPFSVFLLIIGLAYNLVLS